MSLKAIPVDRGVAVPFRITEDGKIIVADYHFQMDADGGWQKDKRPGRPKIAFHLKSVYGSRKVASSIVTNPNLSAYQKAAMADRISQFVHSYTKLSQHLQTPVGNVEIRDDSDELRNLWHLYLQRGRQLIDQIGKNVHVCFGLKQRLKGLNVQGLSKLEEFLRQQMKQGPELESLTKQIARLRSGLIEFVELRNREKVDNDTLVDPPAVSPDGIPMGGAIFNRKNNKHYHFVNYFQNSFNLIMLFARIILQ